MLLPASHHRWFFVSCSFAGFYRGSKVSTVEVQMCVDDFSERYIYESIIKKLAPKKNVFCNKTTKRIQKVRYGMVHWFFAQVSNCPGTAGATWHALFRWKADVLPNREPVGGWPFKQNWAPFDMNFLHGKYIKCLQSGIKLCATIFYLE